MLVTAMVSIQVGSAVATSLFDDIGPGGVVFLRTSISAVLLFVLWRPGLRVFAEHRWLALRFGVTLAGMTLFFYESIDRIPLGMAVTVEFIGPLGVALLTSRSRRDWIWAALAACGIFLLSGWTGSSDVDRTGLAFALVAGLLWGSYILQGKKLGERADGNKILVLPVIVAALVTAPIGIHEGGVALLESKVILVGIAVGVLGSAIPFSLDIAAMRRLPSSVFGVMMSLEPAIAAAVGFLFLSQGLSAVEILAIGLVVAASAGALRSTSVPPPLEP